MKRCLKIRISGNVQSLSYRQFIQKHAQTLNIEGTVQEDAQEGVIVYTCGTVENLDKLIDALYKGTAESHVKEIIAEPFINEKNFRGVFRIIGD